jgi:hypothetical protein
MPMGGLIPSELDGDRCPILKEVEMKNFATIRLLAAISGSSVVADTSAANVPCEEMVKGMPLRTPQQRSVRQL